MNPIQIYFNQVDTFRWICIFDEHNASSQYILIGQQQHIHTHSQIGSSAELHEKYANHIIKKKPLVNSQFSFDDDACYDFQCN